VITDAEGTFIARVDLAWPRFRACVEYEGDGHRTDRAQFRKDITRTQRLEDHGWRVIRITDDDLARGGHEFLHRVRSVLRAREL
jgi:very-short-patch-repair endonuclease